MANKKLKTILSLPENKKLLYVKILAVQAFSDKKLEPDELSHLYLLMTQLGLGTRSRQEIRKFMASGECEIRSLIDKLLSGVTGEDKEIIAFSIIKDMIRISWIDGNYSGDERRNIEEVAHLLFGDNASEKIKLAEDIVKGDDKFIQGGFKSMKQLVDYGKKLSASASAIGVPLTAVYFSGSIGFSAAGITSALAALGLGGVAAVGLSPMVAGIGAVVLIGIGTYSAVDAGFDLIGSERKKKREFLIQEILKLHQRAISSLVEDTNKMAKKQESLARKSKKNQDELAKIAAELEGSE